MPYVNPVPTIDAGKEFEMRLVMKFDHLVSVEQAKQQTAEYLSQQTPETLANWLSCVRIKTLYPTDLTNEELKQLTDQGEPT